jgi:uncharacterized protein (TIGR03437 family)
VLAILLSLSCRMGVQAQEPPITLTRVVEGVTNPTDIQNARDGSGRLFLVQQNGVIRIWTDNALVAEPFLDISSRTDGRGERGLLGLAFPPEYGRKQYFYVNYTNLAGDTIIARYMVSQDPDRADRDSERILLEIDQPFANHNGGQLRFGPDGYLYIGMGDGGGAGDPLNNAQNGGTLLGKMLRIDTEAEPERYRVPAGNPFVDNPSFRPEIWALGLRNPWRFSFDAATRELWIADVGQNRAEEVNVQPGSRGGGNYGWPLMEGLRCFRGECDPTGLVLPVAEYTRESGCSVTGGGVYRGTRSPGLLGTYIYGDYCSGNIWGITRAGETWNNRLLLASGLTITTFGEDEGREMYAGDRGTGTIYRIDGRPGLVVTPSSIVNAASFVPGLAPGSAVTVFVAGLLEEPGIVTAESTPLPGSLAGVQVTVNGVAAPLYSIAKVNGIEQVTFQAPFEIAGSSRVSIAVARAGVASEPVEVSVLEMQPGVFTTDGTAGIVVHHADNALVTRERPLRSGEFAYFYATGLGLVLNGPGTGNPAPVDSVALALTTPRVTLGGISCEVLFAGLAPGFVGVYQINIRAPINVARGQAELVVTQGQSASPAVVVPVE